MTKGSADGALKIKTKSHANERIRASINSHMSPRILHRDQSDANISRSFVSSGRGSNSESEIQISR